MSHTFPADHRLLFGPNRINVFEFVFVLSHQPVPALNSILNHIMIKNRFDYFDSNEFDDENTSQ